MGTVFDYMGAIWIAWVGMGAIEKENAGPC